MLNAINLAKKNLGITAPNPCVGCVIVKNDNIISTGITAKNGRPHAEAIAINKVKDKKLLKNATIYVTLEPCFHHGQTPPCVDAIIESGITKVVIATKDIDQRVNSKSITKLKENNIEVIVGILEKEAQNLNRAFFKAKKEKIPFITLKLATSSNCKIFDKEATNKWISNKKSQNFAHYLRSINDAILIGANTARIDNPNLNCRLSGLEDFSPKKIIFSNSLNLDPNLNIFKNDNNIIITNSQNSRSNLPAKIIYLENFTLKTALQKLHEEGINSILVEGGNQIATSFLEENLVNELIWIKAPHNIENGLAAIANFNQEEFVNFVESKMTKKRQENFDGDVISFFLKK